jgi:hypothetical protein
MTAISKSFSVDDTVYVRYEYGPNSRGFLPATRIVSNIKFIDDSDVCIVSFASGESINDSPVEQRVFTTQAACATAIANDIISKSTALVSLEISPVAVVGTSGTATAFRRWKA